MLDANLHDSINYVIRCYIDLAIYMNNIYNEIDSSPLLERTLGSYFKQEQLLAIKTQRQKMLSQFLSWTICASRTVFK